MSLELAILRLIDKGNRNRFFSGSLDRLKSTLREFPEAT